MIVFDTGKPARLALFHDVEETYILLTEEFLFLRLVGVGNRFEGGDKAEDAGRKLDVEDAFAGAKRDAISAEKREQRGGIAGAHELVRCGVIGEGHVATLESRGVRAGGCEDAISGFGGGLQRRRREFLECAAASGTRHSAHSSEFSSLRE